LFKYRALASRRFGFWAGPSKLRVNRVVKNGIGEDEGGRSKLETRNRNLEIGKAKSREIPHIRRPTASQERSGKKKRRPASFGMTGGVVADAEGTAENSRAD